MPYLYRLDRLDYLREQSADPALRARRVTGARGTFDHHQVLAELQTLQASQGVYRFCFWKNWNVALQHLRKSSSYPSPWMLQRVRAEHPTLARFNRDDDEYLPSDAWIFWRTDRVDPARPDWSPEGIPHEDIDVLTPAGTWERLSTTSLMREASLDHWRCIPLPGIGGPTAVFGRTAMRRIDGDNEVWVLLRQQNGPWTVIWRDPDRLAQATRLMLCELGAVGHANVRWVISLECEDRVLSLEFFPSIRQPAPSTVERVLGIRQAGIERALVTVDDRFEPLQVDAQQRLYRDFGVGEVLLLHRRYEYAPHILQDERVMDREPTPR